MIFPKKGYLDCRICLYQIVTSQLQSTGSENPGPGFTKILKLKFMLKLAYKLIFVSLCSNSNFSHYRKFLNLNSPINSDIISLSEFMLKFTFVGIFENSQAEIMLKLN